MSSVAAASIITLAAKRIGDIDLQQVLKKLDEELIFQVWQLEYLDAHQWKMLGIPIGLVASIKRCIEEKQEERCSPQRPNGPLPANSHAPRTSVNQSDPVNPTDEEDSLSASTPYTFWKVTNIDGPIIRSQPSSPVNFSEKSAYTGPVATIHGPNIPLPPRYPFGSPEDTPLTMPLRRESVSMSTAFGSGESLSREISERVPPVTVPHQFEMNSPPLLPIRTASISNRAMSISTLGSWDEDNNDAEEDDDYPDAEGDDLDACPERGDTHVDEQDNETAEVKPRYLIKETLSAWIDSILDLTAKKEVGAKSATNPTTVKAIETSFQTRHQQHGLDIIRQCLLDGVEVKTRRYRLKSYPDCFVASEMVDFMVEQGWAQTRVEAVRLGQNLQFQFQWFEHVVEPRRHWFADSYLFFKFNHDDDNDPTTIRPLYGPPVRPTRRGTMHVSLSSLNEGSEHSSSDHSEPAK